eukprot:TRINITY_DN21936_c0_g1_i1.p1 TRINITY_DN21936_c0_g1~~TRINITY_DN21936_c0_g1_i1.p1  ORF type:complete len:104 (-),score=8.03 TRINITY_DN21936_c0_g1_i1:173-484(-)
MSADEVRSRNLVHDWRCSVMEAWETYAAAHEWVKEMEEESDAQQKRVTDARDHLEKERAGLASAIADEERRQGPRGPVTAEILDRARNTLQQTNVSSEGDKMR